jgi:PAS domain S-box-containing protein
MVAEDKVNILLVDDQPAKLLSYEIILRELGENLIKANSAREAFEHLLKEDIAVILVDVFMPELDGFELARMIREHPRFQTTAIIFISAVLLTDLDFLQGYKYGAVDYISVPVIPEILRAKVKVFAQLYRTTKQLANLNRELEKRVADRTAELAASTAELSRSEERLRLAFEAAQMGWWDYDVVADKVTWSQSLVRIMGFSPQAFGGTIEGALQYVHPDDRGRFLDLVQQGIAGEDGQNCELRFVRPDGSVRWSLAAGQVIRDGSGRPLHFAGVDLDITQRKQAEERQLTLIRELDHRAKNLLAVVQSVLRLSHADTTAEFIAAVDGRVRALARTHTLLSETRWQSVDMERLVGEEIAPFATDEAKRIVAAGPPISLHPATAQSLALAVHELATNAVKYGALSAPSGRIALQWSIEPDAMVLRWVETDGPPVKTPTRKGFGMAVIEAGVQHQLGGSATFDWRPSGLQCSLAIPRGRFDMPVAVLGTSRPEAASAVQLGMMNGTRRILLVEDEALVGMMMKDMLREIGFSVVGPIPDLPQALAAADDVHLSGAVLDVNIGGVTVYPVAAELARRGIPFVFVSGYSPDGIDRQYAHVPVLEKPIKIEMLRQILRPPASEHDAAD